MNRRPSRLKDAFPYLNRKMGEAQSEPARKVAEAVPEYLQHFEVIGTPEDLAVFEAGYPR